MRLSIGAMFVAALVGCERKQDDQKAARDGHISGDGHAHGTKRGHGDDHGGHGDHRPAMTALDVRTTGEVKAGQPVELELSIPGGAGQPLNDFAVVHDAKVHLILIRDGLDRFDHLHLTPDAATGVMKVKHTFPLGGVYHLFADHQPSGKAAATAVAHVKVAGDAPVAAALTPDVPGTLSGDGLTAKVAVEGAEVGQEATVRFELGDPSGQPVADLERYMGERGHLVVVSADASRYVHAHPAVGQTGANNVVAFGATFPQAGLYKGWGQFKRGGQVRIVPFVVRLP